MGERLTIAAGRVGRFFAQHFWNLEVAQSIDSEGKPCEAARASFYETRTGSAPRLVTIDYQDNYGPLPWSNSYMNTETPDTDSVMQSFDAANIIDARQKLSMYHQYLRDPDSEEGTGLYAAVGAQFFKSCKEYQSLLGRPKGHSSQAGIPGIADVRINFNDADRFPTDFAEPWSTTSFSYGIQRADLLGCSSNFYTDDSVLVSKPRMVDEVQDMIVKQLEACDSLDCLSLFLGTDTHWGQLLTTILDEILPEIPRISAMVYDVSDHDIEKPPHVNPATLRPDPVLMPFNRKCSQALFWRDISDRIGLCALVPLSLTSTRHCFREQSPASLAAFDRDKSGDGLAGNYLTGDTASSLYSSTAVTSLAAHTFVHQASSQGYRLSSVLSGLVPLASGNVLASSLNLSLVGEFYSYTNDLAGISIPYLNYSIDSSFAVMRGFKIDPSTGQQQQPRGLINPYVERYAPLFRQPIIKNMRGLLLRGQVARLPTQFPHFFNLRCGLSYRTELPLAIEVRNTPYYYDTLCTMEAILCRQQQQWNKCGDTIEVEDALQHLCLMKSAYCPPRCLDGLGTTDVEGSSDY